MLAIAVATFVLLLATAARYGYHRDELYFLAAGHHLAWGYPDQPPFTPALARLMSAIAPHSLTVLRLPSALASAADVLLTAAIARELGASRVAQTLAAATMAVSSFMLGAGHLLSTTTFGLLAWTALLWCVVRILRTGQQRLWPVAGVVAGVGLLDNDLVAALLVVIAIGLLIAGPRRVLLSPWLWLGVGIAVALWVPYLVWQGQHGWPELHIARSIANGNSGSSQPRWAIVPFQFLLAGIGLAPVWIAGLVRLFRDPALRWVRALGWAYLALIVVMLILGGKPYYVAQMGALLVAAGAQPAIDWLRRGRRGRRVALGAAFAVAGVGFLIVLPLVPVGSLHSTPIVGINYDAGETVGWPAYVGEIASVYQQTKASAAGPVDILTTNYGEAGAVDRFGPALGLPHAFSGHMGFWYWGPPPEARPAAVIAVGFSPDELHRFFTDVRLVATLDNHVRVDDDEQGANVLVCSGMRETWRQAWPGFRSFG